MQFNTQALELWSLRAQNNLLQLLQRGKNVLLTDSVSTFPRKRGCAFFGRYSATRAEDQRPLGELQLAVKWVPGGGLGGPSKAQFKIYFGGVGEKATFL